MWKEKLEQAENRKLQVTKELQVSFQLSKLIWKFVKKYDSKYTDVLSQIPGQGICFILWKVGNYWKCLTRESTFWELVQNYFGVGCKQDWSQEGLLAGRAEGCLSGSGGRCYGSEPRWWQWRRSGRTWPAVDVGGWDQAHLVMLGWAVSRLRMVPGQRVSVFLGV